MNGCMNSDGEYVYGKAVKYYRLLVMNATITHMSCVHYGTQSRPGLVSPTVCRLLLSYNVKCTTQVLTLSEDTQWPIKGNDGVLSYLCVLRHSNLATNKHCSNEAKYRLVAPRVYACRPSNRRCNGWDSVSRFNSIQRHSSRTCELPCMLVIATPFTLPQFNPHSPHRSPAP